jgi:catechol 2,3-dioxygenase-like lactoylglutathione lyase family enzyme
VYRSRCNDRFVEFKFEVVTLSVRDVDEAKRFYVDVLGFSLDIDYAPSAEFRVVQVTPSGSATSVQFGIGLTDVEPGSARSNYLVVEDIVGAHDELTAKGLSVSAIRHKNPIATWGGQYADGVEPNRVPYASVFDFGDPSGNTWIIQEIRDPGK